MNKILPVLVSLALILGTQPVPGSAAPAAAPDFSILKIAVSPALPNVYFGLVSGGLLIFSQDAGLHWSPVITLPGLCLAGSTQAVGIVRRQEYPDAPVRLLAAAGSAVYRSGDFGATWASQNVTVGVGFCNESPSFDIVTSPADPLLVYLLATCWAADPFGVAAVSALYISRNAGVTWQKILDNNYSAGAVWRIVPSPLIPEWVYAQMKDSWYASSDNGTHWTLMNLSFSDNYILALDAVNPNLMYFGLKRSRDGGQTWESINSPCPTYRYGKQWAAMPGHEGASMILCSFGSNDPRNGVFFSSDQGSSWTKTSGLTGVNLWPVYNDGGGFVWSRSDGLWRFSSASTGWQFISDRYLGLPPHPVFMPAVIK